MNRKSVRLFMRRFPETLYEGMAWPKFVWKLSEVYHKSLKFLCLVFPIKIEMLEKSFKHGFRICVPSFVILE